CNNALEVSQPACIFSIPEGSCNMEKVLSTTTCTNTVNKGECNRELETFVKTCDVDVEETKECVVTIDVTESDCDADAVYTTQACESTREVTEHSCGIKYDLTVTEGSCDGVNKQIKIPGNKHTCWSRYSPETREAFVLVTCSTLKVLNFGYEGSCPSSSGGTTETIDWTIRPSPAMNINLEENGNIFLQEAHTASGDPVTDKNDVWVNISDDAGGKKVCVGNTEGATTRCTTIEMSASSYSVSRTNTCTALDDA
ncbi:hypothetical protein, partial [Pseudoalteromonas marina]